MTTQSISGVWTHLVDRFIDIHAAPTSRKSTIVMAFALPAFVGLGAVTHFTAAASGAVYTTRLDVLLGVGASILLGCLLAALWAERRAGDGRWTAYLIVVLFGGWIAVLIVGFGVFSTPFIAWPPCVVILVGVWYDVRIGWTACVYFLAARPGSSRSPC